MKTKHKLCILATATLALFFAFLHYRAAHWFDSFALATLLVTGAGVGWIKKPIAASSEEEEKDIRSAWVELGSRF